MKKTHILCIFAALITFWISSCKSDDDNNGGASNQEINSWIYENMKTYYLWTDYITSKPNYASNPETFFESLLYTKEDRFSWIQENYTDLLNTLNGVTSKEIGFEYTLWWKSNRQDSLIIEVSYPKNGTDAKAKGIERGDFITSVNGKAITKSNYKTIFSDNSSSYQLLVSKNLGAGKLSTPSTITVTPIAGYAENPVYLYKTISTTAGNVGYLAYHFFADDSGDSTRRYDKELVAALSDFNNQNINNLVLDLRYNSGGAISSAVILASALVKSRTEDLLFARNEYNKEITTFLTQKYGANSLNDYFINNFTPEYPANSAAISIPNLGDKLNHIYILTGRYTASASELIINGLKPYMNITLIGDSTYGKNVGSISIYDETSKTNKWGMQPIITKIYNSKNQSDYANGFAPDYAADDNYDSSNGYVRVHKPLGDENEYLLSIALNLIQGSMLRSRIDNSAFTKRVMKPNFNPEGRSFDMYINNKHLLKKRLN